MARKKMNNWLTYEWWGNSVKDYIWVFGLMIVFVLLFKGIKKFLFKKIKKLTGKSETIIDDLIADAAERFVLPWFLFFVNYHLLHRLQMHPQLKTVVSAAMYFVTLFYAVSFINFMITQAVVVYMKQKQEPPERIRQLNGVLTVIRIVVWLAGFLMLIDNLGYDVTTIVAGLGVGGIAVALAAQNILGDLFSYLVIFFDKPFETGDFIMGSGYSGIVERIGIKTTHVRSLEGQQLIVPNAEMSKTVIQNFKRLNRRRIVFSIGVVYKTKVEQLKKIPDLIQRVIDDQEQVSFDRVHLKSFGDFSILFETVYFVESAEMIVYLNAHHSICMRLFELFSDEHIEFAFPTQTIYLEQNEKITASQVL